MKKIALTLLTILCLVLAAGCGNSGGTGGNGGGAGGATPSGSSVNGSSSIDNGSGSDNGSINNGSGSDNGSSIDNGSGSIDNGNSGPQEEGVQPDKFSFSGGTGRVGISARNIVSRNDAAFVTIVFDSDSYTHIRKGNNIYECEHADGTSYAEIPILLNENNTIYAETTKMSQAHEIEYQIMVYSAGTANAGRDPYALIRAQIDEKAPVIPGVPEASIAATIETDRCTVFTYEYGIYLLEERVSDKDINEADIGITTRAISSEDAQELLYQKPVVKYLLVPEGKEELLPAGIEKEAILVTIPAANIYEGAGDIDLKDIVASGCRLIMLDTSALENDAEVLKNLGSDAAYLGIPVIINPEHELIRALLIG